MLAGPSLHSLYFVENWFKFRNVTTEFLQKDTLWKWPWKNSFEIVQFFTIFSKTYRMKGHFILNSIRDRFGLTVFYAHVSVILKGELVWINQQCSVASFICWKKIFPFFENWRYILYAFCFIYFELYSFI